MSAGERAAWTHLIPRLYAEEVLRERGGSLGPEQLYRALILSGTEKREAEKARARRALEQMRDQSS